MRADLERGRVPQVDESALQCHLVQGEAVNSIASRQLAGCDIVQDLRDVTGRVESQGACRTKKQATFWAQLQVGDRKLGLCAEL